MQIKNAVEPYQLQPLKRKRSKYRNVKTAVDGIMFDSKREAEVYKQLKMLEANGKICCFNRQVPYALIVNGEKIGTYRADFFVHFYGEKSEIWDAKGMLTPIYKLKKKLMKAIYGIEIKEV